MALTSASSTRPVRSASGPNISSKRATPHGAPPCTRSTGCRTQRRESASPPWRHPRNARRVVEDDEPRRTEPAPRIDSDAKSTCVSNCSAEITPDDTPEMAARSVRPGCGPPPFRKQLVERDTRLDSLDPRSRDVARQGHEERTCRVERAEISERFRPTKESRDERERLYVVGEGRVGRGRGCEQAVLVGRIVRFSGQRASSSITLRSAFSSPKRYSSGPA